MLATLMPRLIRSDKDFFENGQSGQSSYSAHGYDALGNISYFEEGGSGVEPVQAHIGYASDPACAANHIVGLPNSIIVTAHGEEKRRRDGEVDCATAKLKTQRAHINGNAYAQTDFSWDAYGNLATLLGPHNHKQQRLSLAYRYDSATNTYPVRIDNLSYGNPPDKSKAREVEFSMKEVLREEVEIYRQPNHGCLEAC